MTIIPVLALVLTPMTNPLKDPAFILASKLVGHTWAGTIGKGVTVEFKFTSEDGGNKIVGTGIVGKGSKSPMRARTSLGWDVSKQKVYYLDQHGFDTVYFGYVSNDGDDLVFDFTGLVGDKGHYRSRTKIDSSRYSSTMEVEDHGKWKDLGFHLGLKKIR